MENSPQNKCPNLRWYIGGLATITHIGHLPTSKISSELCLLLIAKLYKRFGYVKYYLCGRYRRQSNGIS